MTEQKKMLEVWFIIGPKPSVLMIAKQTVRRATRYGKKTWLNDSFWASTDMEDSMVVPKKSQSLRS
jgi:hypothetical protein